METFVLPCRAASIRGQLKHTYLTNTICLKTQPEKLRVSMAYEENGIPRHQIIRNQIAELLELIGSPDQGFSPAQLVDQLHPFRQLPDAERRSMKGQIHQQFVKRFDVAARKGRLEQLASQLLAALDAFLAQPLSDAKSASAHMEHTQESARTLIRELEDLPKGIWLWKTTGSETMSS
jgi:hypothetical protein